MACRNWFLLPRWRLQPDLCNGRHFESCLIQTWLEELLVSSVERFPKMIEMPNNETF